MLSSLSLFDDFFDRRPTVYVISENRLEAWKREKAEGEIIELDRLIDSHKQAIERLEVTRKQLRDAYPVLEPPTPTEENVEKS